MYETKQTSPVVYRRTPFVVENPKLCRKDSNYAHKLWLNPNKHLYRLAIVGHVEMRSRDNGCYTEEVIISICVTFGEDCIAIYLMIGYWNQVS